jgi:hypothetical protein
VRQLADPGSEAADVVDRELTQTAVAGVPGMTVFDFVEGWYNPKRRHSALGYLSPVGLTHFDVGDMVRVQRFDQGPPSCAEGAGRRRVYVAKGDMNGVKGESYLRAYERERLDGFGRWGLRLRSVVRTAAAQQR